MSEAYERYKKLKEILNTRRKLKSISPGEEAGIFDEMATLWYMMTEAEQDEATTAAVKND